MHSLCVHYLIIEALTTVLFLHSHSFHPQGHFLGTPKDTIHYLLLTHSAISSLLAHSTPFSTIFNMKSSSPQPTTETPTPLLISPANSFCLFIISSTCWLVKLDFKDTHTPSSSFSPPRQFFHTMDLASPIPS